MPFKFLPLQQLQDNTRDLLVAVEVKHKETLKEITDSRRAQMNLLDSLPAKLKKLTALKYDGDLELKDIQKQLDELAQTPELSEEQSQLQKKLKEDKTNVVNFMSNILLEEIEEKINVSVARDLRKLNDEQRAMITTGALLAIKAEIDFEFSGKISKMLGYLPTSTVLYNGIDAAIGVTPENQLDEKSKLQALAAYKDFAIRTNVMNVKTAENVKDEDIRSVVTAKHHLKKIKQADDRVAALTLENSTNPLQLLPKPELKAQAQDKNLPEKVRKMVSDQLAEYTPESELARYVRGKASKQNYQHMRKILKHNDIENFNKNRLNGLGTIESGNVEGPQQEERIPVEAPVFGTVRQATQEEHMAYDLKEKKYNEEDKKKIKWANGVKEPYGKTLTAFTLFNDKTKAKIDGFDMKKLKHAETKETHIVQVPRDLDSKSRPRLK